MRALLKDAAKGIYFVAEQDGAVIGQLLITYEWSDWRNGYFWWIQSVYVAAEFRPAGSVSRACFDMLRSLARSRRDVCGLRLYVEKNNRRAHPAYERLGMKHTHYEIYETAFRCHRICERRTHQHRQRADARSRPQHAPAMALPSPGRPRLRRHAAGRRRGHRPRHRGGRAGSAGARRPRHHHRRTRPDLRRHHARSHRPTPGQATPRGRQPSFSTSNNSSPSRKRPMPASTRVQAMVPEGAIVLANPNGTAPGLAMKVEAGGWKMEMHQSPPAQPATRNPPKLADHAARPAAGVAPHVQRHRRALAAPRVAARRRICLSHAAHHRHRGIAGRRQDWRAVAGRSWHADWTSATAPTSAQVDVRLAAHGPQADATRARSGNAWFANSSARIIFGEDDETWKPSSSACSPNGNKPSPSRNPAPAAHRASTHQCARRLGGFAGRAGDLQQRGQAKVPRGSRRNPRCRTGPSAKPWREKWPKARGGRPARTTPFRHRHRRTGWRQRGQAGRHGVHRVCQRGPNHCAQTVQSV